MAALFFHCLSISSHPVVKLSQMAGLLDYDSVFKEWISATGSTSEEYGQRKSSMNYLQCMDLHFYAVYSTGFQSF